MPSNPKKTPSGQRKRVTASARARISTKKIRLKNQIHEESFLQDGMLASSSVSSPQPPPPVQTNHDMVLAMLSDIKASNQSLSDRMTKLERQSSEPSYPTSHWSHLQGQAPGLSRHQGTATIPHVHYSGEVRGAQTPRPATGSTTSLSSEEQTGSNHHPQTTGGRFSSNLPSDAVLPSLETIRRLPNVSEAVSGILASYDSHNRLESSQGKPHRRSRRYNTHDTVSVAPEVRWPNEGFHGSNGKKRLLYDDLSMPQWVAGQLTNILHMQDQATSKQALIQVIAAMKDAVSIPFTAVKNAWACSMHELEEGNLTWNDSTQWALNRLSASQVSLINSHSAPSALKKFCKYFNEGSCTHDGHHGLYKHNCSFCGKQGRTANHPENKCNFRSKKQEKGATSS